MAIHLWNVRQGKTLKVGSVELLMETAQQRAKSLRLTELLLLLLRCLLIVLLSLLLAGPYWKSAGDKGWIVVEKNIAQRAFKDHKTLIDSLLEKGYTTHVFAKGFAEADPATITQDRDTVPRAYWPLIRQLQAQKPAGIPVYLFTGNQLRHFNGARPTIDFNLVWTTIGTDSVSSFVDHAYTTADDSLAVITATTSSHGTIYHTTMMGLDRPSQGDLFIDVRDGLLQVRYKQDAPVQVDTTTAVFTVYADLYLADADYVVAALQSIQQFTKRKMVVRRIARLQDLPRRSDALFWLSDQPAPPDRATWVMAYAGGAVVANHSWIQDVGNPQTRVTLYKRTVADRDTGNVLLRDGFGQAVLTGNTLQTHFKLYTHFDPAWSELVWSEAFPQLVSGWIDRTADKTNNHDLRVVDTAVLRLPVQERMRQPVVMGEQAVWTHRILWLLLLLIFIGERYLSFRIPKKQAGA